MSTSIQSPIDNQFGLNEKLESKTLLTASPTWVGFFVSKAAENVALASVSQDEIESGK
jgi:hypothetical protein